MENNKGQSLQLEREAYARGYAQARRDIAVRLLEMRVPMQTIAQATGISIAELQAYPMG